ncbi:MAG: hypothetical protein WB554_18625 [Desulfomonilaceae bacterium]
MKTSSSRVTYPYDVMDSAYDTGPIYELSRNQGHVPIIDKNSRGKDIIPMAPHGAARKKEKTAVESFNSRLKEEFGQQWPNELGQLKAIFKCRLLVHAAALCWGG